jgi:hypothetical protein
VQSAQVNQGRHFLLLWYLWFKECKNPVKAESVVPDPPVRTLHTPYIPFSQSYALFAGYETACPNGTIPSNFTHCAPCPEAAKLCYNNQVLPCPPNHYCVGGKQFICLPGRICVNGELQSNVLNTLVRAESSSIHFAKFDALAHLENFVSYCDHPMWGIQRRIVSIVRLHHQL